MSQSRRDLLSRHQNAREADALLLEFSQVVEIHLVRRAERLLIYPSPNRLTQLDAQTRPLAELNDRAIGLAIRERLADE